MGYIGNTQQNQNYFPAVDFFSGNGSTTAFTLTRPVASTAAIQVIVSNVAQNPSSAYTVNGNTITFTSAPPSGTNNIYVYYTSPNTTVVQPSQGTVYPSSLSTGGPTWDTAGNLTLNNGAADGAQLVMKSAGYSDWNLDNYSGRLRAYYGGTEYFTINSSGNVGIGTISPSRKLTVAGTDNQINVTTGTNELIVRANSSEAALYTFQAIPLSFYTNNAERMRIDSNGNLLVGLGSSNLGGKFEVAGNVSGSGTTRYPYIGSSTGTAMVIDGSGYFRASSSSRRYKENIEPIDVGLAEVLQMEPVKYDLKENGSAQVGFIAEDFPEQRLVNYSMVDPEDPSKGEQVESVNYANLTAILVKAIQELKAEVDDLKAQLEAK